MTSTDDTDTVKAVTLAGTDGTLAWMAARLLLALPGGPPRMDAFEGLVQSYRDDLAEAHDSTDPDTLDDMATNFAGALWLAMARIVEGDDRDRWDAPLARGGPHLVRRRVLEEIGRFMKAVDPRH